MTEIKKITKIALIWYGVAGLLFAFSYLVLTEIFAWTIMQWPYNDPVTFWSMGISLLAFGIGSLMAYFKKEWEEIKLLFVVMLMWVLMSLIMDIFIVTLLNLLATPMMFMIVNIVLLAFNLVLGIYSWMKQRS
ncbi:MAG: hypothetical protein KGD67_01220 [Candidatus Lokiarchaeota archaeon]|nr:hypothetical protein [Candidatus Lokiarchaeota archaeon]